jgi:hypothetical protein
VLIRPFGNSIFKRYNKEAVLFLTSVINLGQLELDCQAIQRCVIKAKLIFESLNKLL